MKRDKYFQRRGGIATILDIHCSDCDNRLFKYQKDGKGRLQRCYLNRIFDPKIKGKKKVLSCGQCGKVIGHLIVYHDGRPAYRLEEGSVVKKRGKN